MIELDGIRRVYHMGGEELQALASIDETIRPGEFVALMGPSGSGNSTLLNVIGCLDRPTGGSYHLEGRAVAGLSDDALSRVRRGTFGFVFQAYHLIPRLSALANVEVPLVFAGIARAERRRRAQEALAAVGLTDRAEHRPAELSGGQCQRVAIARATILKPRILLADEPTGNLDSAAGAQVLNLIDSMHASGMTVVMVTHDPQVAVRADRVLLLEDGHVVRRLNGADLATGAASTGGAVGIGGTGSGQP